MKTFLTRFNLENNDTKIIIKIHSPVTIDHRCNFSPKHFTTQKIIDLFEKFRHTYILSIRSRYTLLWAVVHDISTSLVGSSLISANYRLSTRVTRIFQFSRCNSIPQLFPSSRSRPRRPCLLPFSSMETHVARSKGDCSSR